MGKACVSIRSSGKNFSSLAIHFFFDEESHKSVNICCLSGADESLVWMRCTGTVHGNRGEIGELAADMGLGILKNHANGLLVKTRRLLFFMGFVTAGMVAVQRTMR